MRGPTSSKPGRNEPCHCGSGRKYKKCHWDLDQRPREVAIYIGHHEPFSGATLRYGARPTIHVPGEGESVRPNDAFSQTQYPGLEGKDKVVDRVDDRFVPDISAYVVGEFRAAFAIDTNTLPIGTDRVSIACICEAPQNRAFSFPKIIPFKNCAVGEEERYSWLRLVNMISENSEYRPRERVAIITDHDRNNLGRYNRRECAIYEGTYLPENFELVYASADAGGQ